MLDRNRALKSRGERVLPGGMYGHMSTYRLLPPRYPQYFERAEGCRLWDADGNEYIDFMCSFGPMIAGYGNRRIRAAADAQRDRLDIANGPPPLIIDLAGIMFLSVAHTEAEIEQALAGTEKAFQALG